MAEHFVRVLALRARTCIHFCGRADINDSGFRLFNDGCEIRQTRNLCLHVQVLHTTRNQYHGHQERKDSATSTAHRLIRREIKLFLHHGLQ